jgi:hypothetical protein
VITGRGPGAPSVTPDTVLTLHPDARSEPGNPAVDLSAIRRSEAIINLLGGRRLLRPRALHDPALRLLSSLAADADAEPLPVAPARPGPAPASTWVHVAAVAATVAAVAGLAGGGRSALAGVLGRLARLPASVRKEPAGWGYRPPVTGRPVPRQPGRPRRSR